MFRLGAVRKSPSNMDQDLGAKKTYLCASTLLVTKNRDGMETRCSFDRRHAEAEENIAGETKRDP